MINEQDRPSVVSEVRAWVVAGVSVCVFLLGNTVSIVWWAATLNQKMSSVQDILLSVVSKTDSLELRVRDLERKHESTEVRIDALERYREAQLRK